MNNQSSEGMVSPLTQRERALRAALVALVGHIKREELEAYKELRRDDGKPRRYPLTATDHSIIAGCAALADPPPPDPRDEALRLANDIARQLNTALNEMYQGACDRIGISKTAEKHSRQLLALANYQQYRDLADNRATKGDDHDT